MGPKQRKNYQGNIEGFLSPTRPRQRINSSQPLGLPLDRQEPSPKPQETFKPAINYNQYYSTQTSRLNQPKTKHKNKKWSTKRKVLSCLATFMILILGIGGWYGSHLLANLDKVFHGNVISDAKALFSTTKLKGENQGRVNILLAGDSADDPNHGGADLTDSIMIVSIDTKNKTGFMMSIPRDLWVDIPAFSEHQKINAANDVSNFKAAGYPSGGMGQLQQIVQSDLGIPIDYYALIDYSAFRDAVNAVGGITINLQTNDPRGIFDPNIDKIDGGPLKLPNGEDFLNGQTALNLARARGDPCSCGQVAYGFTQSDYDRTEHQRQMLSALIQKAQTVGVLANPIKVSQLFNAFGNNIQTNLSLQNVLRFIQITKGINMSKLQSVTYSDSGSNALLTNYLASDGEEALIPTAGLDNFGALQQYYQQLTSDNPVVREAPSVVVLNGTNTNGLAHSEATTLKANGFNVVGVADASNLYQSTLIIDNTNGKKPASQQYLQSLFARNGSTTTSKTSSLEAAEADGYNADFVVVLGQNTSSTTQQP